jgi:hypothetical protein
MNCVGNWKMLAFLLTALVERPDLHEDYRNSLSMKTCPGLFVVNLFGPVDIEAGY